MCPVLRHSLGKMFVKVSEHSSQRRKKTPSQGYQITNKIRNSVCPERFPLLWGSKWAFQIWQAHSIYQYQHGYINLCHFPLISFLHLAQPIRERDPKREEKQTCFAKVAIWLFLGDISMSDEINQAQLSWFKDLREISCSSSGKNKTHKDVLWSGKNAVLIFYLSI